MHGEPVSQRLISLFLIRIDIPLVTTHAYLFTPWPDAWTPWWAELHQYVLRYLPDEPEWRHEPVQDVYVFRPELNDEQKRFLLELLHSAPDEERDGHRTLRRATQLPIAKAPGLRLVFFGHGPAGEWARLAESNDERARVIVSRLYSDPRVHSYFPYTSLGQLHISRNAKYPWDNVGLPYIAPRSDAPDRYTVRSGDSEPLYEGDADGAVQYFLSLLDRLAKPRNE